MIANFLFSFVTSLREILEAALLVGVVLAYLSKIGRKDLYREVNCGVILSAIGGIGFAAIILQLFQHFNKYQVLIEGIVMFIAAGILSWMIMWMGKQSHDIETKIQNKVDQALTKGAKFGLFSLIFISIFRELAELVLLINAYLMDQAQQESLGSAIMTSLFGILLGLVIAVGLAILLFKSTINLNLPKFFKVTSLILVLFAAGLVAHGIHEFHEYFLQNNSPLANLIIFTEAWNINETFLGDILHFLFSWCYDPAYPEKFEASIIGRVLGGLLGWNDNPGILEAVAYFAYYISIYTAYKFINKHAQARTL